LHGEGESNKPVIAEPRPGEGRIVGELAGSAEQFPPGRSAQIAQGEGMIIGEPANDDVAMIRCGQDNTFVYVSDAGWPAVAPQPDRAGQQRW
jgi:hypothetical protein